MGTDSPTVSSSQRLPAGEQSGDRLQLVPSPIDFSSDDTSGASTPDSSQTRSGTAFHADTPSSSLERIPAFHDESGLQWGPYDLHPEKFQPKEYPLWMSELAHLYTQDGTTPAALVNERRMWLGPKFRLSTDPFVYRPEPNMLNSIATTIKGVLRAADIRFERPAPQQEKYFYHGMFLWPPVQRSANGLLIEARVLENKYKRTIYNRLRHGRALTGFFKLTFPSETQPRSILVTMTSPGPFTTLDTAKATGFLWMFSEPRHFERSATGRPVNRKGLAFIGVIFLPKGAKEALLESGQMIQYIPR